VVTGIVYEAQSDKFIFWNCPNCKRKWSIFNGVLKIHKDLLSARKCFGIPAKVKCYCGEEFPVKREIVDG